MRGRRSSSLKLSKVLIQKAVRERKKILCEQEERRVTGGRKEEGLLGAGRKKSLWEYTKEIGRDVMTKEVKNSAQVRPGSATPWFDAIATNCKYVILCIRRLNEMNCFILSQA